MLRVNKIASFAVLDLETTGFPGRQFDRATITEISIHGLAADSISENIITYNVPRIIHKLTLVFNPLMMIHPIAMQKTGLCNAILEEESYFDLNAALVIVNFLKHLRQPVCLVSHNGNRFDFPLLKHTLDKLEVQLPHDVLCIDTLVAFKAIDRLNRMSVPTPSPTRVSYSLPNIYSRRFGKDPENTHQAESDVIALEKVVLSYGNSFVEYAAANAKPFGSIISGA